jgi:hypothetical protein
VERAYTAPEIKLLRERKLRHDWKELRRLNETVTTCFIGTIEEIGAHVKMGQSKVNLPVKHSH